VAGPNSNGAAAEGRTPLAPGVVGVEVHLPGAAGRDGLEAALYGWPPDAASQPAELDAGELACRLAGGALADAGLSAGAAASVVVAGEAAGAAALAELVRARWRLDGQAIDAPLAGGGLAALERGAVALATGRRRFALVVGVAAAAAPGKTPDWRGVGLVLAGLPGRHAYAALDAVLALGAGEPEEAPAAARRAAAAAGIRPDRIAFVDAGATAPARSNRDPLAGLAALARICLCLRGGFTPHPAVPGRTRRAPRPWLRRQGSGRRAIAVDPAGGRPVAALVGEPAVPARDMRPFVPRGPATLVPFAAESLDGLREATAALAGALERGLTLRAAAVRCSAVARTAGTARLALVASSADELAAELAAARRAVDAGSLREWSTPRGSCLAVRPTWGRSSVAFVYPGAFSAYPGVAPGVFQLFPATLAGIDAAMSDPARVFALDLLNPPPGATARELSALEAALPGDPVPVMSASMAYSVFLTRALRDVFGLEPSHACGYSLGESSMLLSLGVWTAGDRLDAGIRSTPLFRTRLSGPMDAVAEFWARRGHRPRRPDAPWAVEVVLADRTAVEAVLPRHDRAFLSIVNAPGEVVIAGDPDALERVVGELGCDHVPLPFHQALHAPPAESELARFVELNRHPVSPVDGIAFHSATSASPLRLEEREIAKRLAELACDPLDFEALVRRVYDAGARVFVEAGPGNMATRLVGAILKGRDHLAVAVDRRGVDAHTSLVRLLARLYAHAVPVDLAPLIERVAA
jgi:PfaB family protein